MLRNPGRRADKKTMSLLLFYVIKRLPLPIRMLNNYNNIIFINL